ncbi:hypothetical protein HDV01_005847 [Terramyces sp. JEL0728]|nr:hypothetical protein HDV01_005847 [Terramyces sp. JEL0728]
MLSLLFASAYAQSLVYGPCDPAKYPYSGKQISVAIKPTLTQTPIVISGNIAVLDGCTFAVENFIFYNAGESYWIGGIDNQTVGAMLSDQFVYPAANPSTYNFTMTKKAGAATNFYMFNQFRLFEINSQTIIATANLPYPVGASSTTASGSTATSAGASSGSSSTAASAKSDANSRGTASVVALALAFGFIQLLV